MRKLIILTMFVALVAACCLTACFCNLRISDPIKLRMNVVIISSDTTRSESLSSYGDLTGLMPNLDRLIKSGTQIRFPVSVATCTLPSHTSIMTGQFPDRHGVIGNESLLGEESMTLAKFLRGYGYETACFCAVSILGDLARDFEERNMPEKFWRRSGDYLEGVCGYLDSKKAQTEKPFFLWIHSFDPHHPYSPPSPYSQIFSEVADGESFFDYESQEEIPTGYELGYPKKSTLAKYYGALKYWDKGLGKIMNKISQIPNTLVIFVADHGENLGEGDLWGHVIGTEQVLRIPMVFYHTNKEIVPAGKIANGVGQQTDIFPTIVSVLGLSAPAGIDGKDLLPVIQGKTQMEHRRAYSLSDKWAYLSDPEKDLKFRRRLFGSGTSSIGTKDYDSLKSYFEDSIIDNGEFEWNPNEDGKFFAEYSGTVKVPGAYYLEGIDLVFEAIGTKVIASEWKLDEHGNFQALMEDKTNFWQAMGENMPFACSSGSDSVYAVRILDKERRLLWQSPWISYRSYPFQEKRKTKTESFIYMGVVRKNEVGVPATEFPERDEFAYDLDKIMHRPNGFFHWKGSRKEISGIILPGAQYLSPDQAYAMVREENSPSTQVAVDTNQLEALRSLGYVN